MLIFIFGILQFYPCWQIIDQTAELVKFIKSKLPSVNSRLGVAYITDGSRHPVPIKPALMKRAWRSGLIAKHPRNFSLCFK